MKTTAKWVCAGLLLCFCGVTLYAQSVTPVPPVITDFTPKSGSVGDVITITGTGLSEILLVSSSSSSPFERHYYNSIDFGSRHIWSLHTTSLETESLYDATVRPFEVKSDGTELKVRVPASARTGDLVFLYYIEAGRVNSVQSSEPFTIVESIKSSILDNSNKVEELKSKHNSEITAIQQNIRAIKARDNNQSDSLRTHQQDIKVIKTRDNNQSDSLRTHQQDIRVIKTRDNNQSDSLRTHQQNIKVIKTRDNNQSDSLRTHQQDIKVIKTRDNNQSDSLRTHQQNIRAIKTRDNNQSDSLRTHQQDIKVIKTRDNNQSDSRLRTQDSKIAALEARIQTLEAALVASNARVQVFSVPTRVRVQPQIYPNPTAEGLSFRGLSSTERYSYKIYTVTGVLVDFGVLPLSHHLQLTRAPGQYLLVLLDEQQTELLKTSVLIE